MDEPTISTLADLPFHVCRPLPQAGAGAALHGRRLRHLREPRAVRADPRPEPGADGARGAPRTAGGPAQRQPPGVGHRRPGDSHVRRRHGADLPDPAGGADQVHPGRLRGDGGRGRRRGAGGEGARRVAGAAGPAGADRDRPAGRGADRGARDDLRRGAGARPPAVDAGGRAGAALPGGRGGNRPRPAGRHHLHLRHDRRPQGRDAHARRHRRQPARRGHHGARHRGRRGAVVPAAEPRVRAHRHLPVPVPGAPP